VRRRRAQPRRGARGGCRCGTAGFGTDVRGAPLRCAAGIILFGVVVLYCYTTFREGTPRARARRAAAAHC
jgi:hypothetical protein